MLELEVLSDMSLLCLIPSCLSSCLSSYLFCVLVWLAIRRAVCLTDCLTACLSVFLLLGFESLGIEKNVYRIAASRESKLIDFVEGIER
jgi:hypothetical protein